MSGYVLKAAAAPIACVLDWRRGHLAAGERVLRDLGWAVHAADGADALRVVRQSHDATRSWAEFAGGEPGRFYIVTSRVRTSDDRDLGQAIVVRIARGDAPQ